MWERILKQVAPPSKKWLVKAWERIDNLSKLKRGLGRLEEIAARVVGIREGHCFLYG